MHRCHPTRSKNSNGKRAWQRSLRNLGMCNVKAGDTDRKEDAPSWPVDFGDNWPDRKSTRLNSSHVEISYAVFCLKKKNQGVPISEVGERNTPGLHRS